MSHDREGNPGPKVSLVLGPISLCLFSEFQRLMRNKEDEQPWHTGMVEMGDNGLQTLLQKGAH